MQLNKASSFINILHAKCFHIQYLLTLTTTLVGSLVIIFILLMRELRLDKLTQDDRDECKDFELEPRQGPLTPNSCSVVLLFFSGVKGYYMKKVSYGYICLGKAVDLIAEFLRNFSILVGIPSHCEASNGHRSLLLHSEAIGP